MGTRKRAKAKSSQRELTSLKGSYKYVEGIQCPLCKEKLWSMHNHDFHYCGCDYCFVDGGKWYVRYGWGGSAGQFRDQSEKPKLVKFRVPLEDWLASDRNRTSSGRFPY